MSLTSRWSTGPCASSTSNDGPAVGHADSNLTDGDPADRWNAAHAIATLDLDAACSAARFAMTKGEGRVYCFAID